MYIKAALSTHTYLLPTRDKRAVIGEDERVVQAPGPEINDALFHHEPKYSACVSPSAVICRKYPCGQALILSFLVYIHMYNFQHAAPYASL